MMHSDCVLLHTWPPIIHGYKKMKTLELYHSRNKLHVYNELKMNYIILDEEKGNEAIGN